MPTDSITTDLLPDIGETAIQPEMFLLLNGLGGYNYGFFFASKDRDDDTFNLYIHIGIAGFVDPPIIPLVVDPTLDFTSPIPATDGTHVAFIAADPAETYGTLYVMAGSFETATAIAENVAGQVCWYDPTP